MTRKEAQQAAAEIQQGLKDAYAPFKGEKSRRFRVRLSPELESAFWEHLWPDDYDGRRLGGVESVVDWKVEGWSIESAVV